MKRSVTVNVNEEKLSAIEMYLEQKSTTLAAELDKYIEQLYSKVVPQNVMVLSISLDTFYSNKNYATRKI